MSVAIAIISCCTWVNEAGKIEQVIHRLKQWSPTFLAPGTGLVEDNFSTYWGGGDGFGMIQAHYIYCALYFYYCYIVINKIMK